MRRLWLVSLTMAVVLLTAPPASAQGGPGGGGGGSGDPDVSELYGDLVWLLRDQVSGQPILAQRWVELPRGAQGYGWGYCPIPVDISGNELAFVPYTCDPLDPTATVEMDLGRLNSSRTTERNQRMHFDEAITRIKAAERVRSEGSGRLLFGTDCTPDGECAEWGTIDSPQENLGLYRRLLKWGHLQTDPAEIDEDADGDPNAPPVYHPALGPEDWAKLDPSLFHLLPDDGATDCFPGGVFLPACVEQEEIDNRDLLRGAGFVAGAADKTAAFDVDTVQYVVRLIGITRETETTPPTLSSVPALVRDCWDSPDDPPSPPEDDPAPVDPPYDPPELCDISPADPTLPNYDLFAVAGERFVDVSILAYERVVWRSQLVDVILPVPGSSELWRRTLGVSLLPWLEWRNGPDGATDMPGYVLAANDSLRWIEFVHNYEIPVDLFAAAGTDPALFRDGFESATTHGWGNGQQGP